MAITSHRAPVVVTGPGPATLTGGGASGSSEVTITVEAWARASLKFACADGTEIEVKPGKSKTVFLQGGNYHLLDCTCEACLATRLRRASTPV